MREYPEYLKECGAIHPTYPDVRCIRHGGCKYYEEHLGILTTRYYSGISISTHITWEVDAKAEEMNG